MTDKTPKILAIDDTPDNLKTLAAVLEDALPGCTLLTATNGPSGIELARTEDPDVILLDIVMPKMDGFAVCRTLKEDGRLQNIPVVFLTALRTDQENRIKGLEAGAEGFLAKPLDTIELVTQIRAMAKIRAANRLRGLEHEELTALVAERTFELERELDERKRAEEIQRKLAERLSNLRRTDRAILKAITSPEDIVQTALFHLRGLLGCQRASVGIFDLEKKEVQVFAANASLETIERNDEPLSEDAFGDLEILGRGETEIVEDMSKVSSPPTASRILHMEGMLSSINHPLISAKGLYGALHIGWEHPRTITPEEVEIVAEVARHVTLTIEQARLLQETKHHAVELEQRVTERTALLASANKELEAFAYSVSHDLRAPLRAIDGYTRILLEDCELQLDAEGKRVCTVIIDSARNMGKLIDDLLAFSRIGRAALQPTIVDMETMAKSVFSELTSQKDRERIDFHLNPLPPVKADPNLIRQVWVNLLSNAIKFSSKKEQAIIELGAEHNTNELVYSIKDNGAGFDMQYREKLFGVFQRLHSMKEFDGTGVGLAIVQRIIHRHEGRVWAEGEIDRGATLHFSLKVGE